MKSLRRAFLFPVLLPMLAGGCGVMPEEVHQGFTKVQFSSAQRMSLMDDFFALAGPLSGGIFLYVSGEASPSFGTNIRINQADPVNATGNLTLPNGTYRFFAFGYQSVSLGGTLHCGQATGGAILLDGGTKTVNLVMDAATCGAAPFATGSYVFSAAPKQIAIHNCDSTEFATASMGTSCSALSSPTVSSIQSVRIGFPLYTASDSNVSDLPGQPAPDTSNSVCLTITGSVTAPYLPYGDPAIYGASVSSPRIFMRIAFYAGNTSCGVPPSLTYDFPEGMANLANVKRFDASKNLIGSGGSVVKIDPGTGMAKLFLKN